MRLIDADALRAEYQAILDRGDMFCEYDIVGMVDNAPTVEGEIEILTKEAYSDLCLRASRERPTGKWIPVTNGRGGNECSVCHNYAPSYMSGDEYLSDFCPKCGADMRKEEKNEGNSNNSDYLRNIGDDLMDQ